jgi:hypothetical protein
MGYVASSFDEHGTRYDASIGIRQSWTRIRAILRTENSESHSLIATIITADPDATALGYEYLNEPKAHAKTTMHAHRGMARLTLRELGSRRVLDGEYYTGRDRQNYGILHFERLQEKSET